MLDNCAVQVTVGRKIRAISVEPITVPAPDYLFVHGLEHEALRERRMSPDKALGRELAGRSNAMPTRMAPLAN
jgi:hypothetical protein